ncbi:MAG: phosphoglucosamine mutase [Acidobacteriota bacterium]|nr:phosphoglucosamine mutase [Acidobacteriota bacterium]
MKARLFGTDGIRGIAGEYPLDARTIFACGSALVRVLGSPLRVLLGRDTRESGPWIERLFAAGVRAAGGEVVSAGVFTTPGIAYLVRAHAELDAGVVISASHNPYRDNGIKIFSAEGMKLDDAQEAAIEREIEALARELEFEARDHLESASGEFAEERFAAEYLQFLRERGMGASSGERPLAGWRLGFDGAHGAAYRLGPQLLEGLGAHVRVIGAAPDGRNINHECGSLHPEALQRVVREHNCDLGIAVDGDADRAIFIARTGEVLDGDDVLYILATYRHERGQLRGNVVVGTEMTNYGLEQALAQRGIALVRAKVGDRYVLEQLLRHGASLGGEPSGHVIVPELSPTGDGLLTALLLLNVMRETGRDVTELRAGFLRYPQHVLNVRVREKPPLETIPELLRAMAEAQERLRDRGRVLVRYSGTEPVARVMVEADAEDLVREIAAALAEVIHRHLGVS